MDAMAMSLQDQACGSPLRQLAPGDSISAEVVVVEPKTEDEDAVPDYWLENVKVTEHAKSPPAAAANSMHMPAPGEDVPDFSFTNQDGKRHFAEAISREGSARHLHLHALPVSRFLSAHEQQLRRDLQATPRESIARRNASAEHQLRSRARHAQGSSRLRILRGPHPRRCAVPALGIRRSRNARLAEELPTSSR